MATTKKQQAERLAGAVRDRSKNMPVERLSLVSGVSSRTINYFRQGRIPSLATLKKLDEAAEALKKRRGKATVKEVVASLKRKVSDWSGQTTVKEITGARYCGWCGERHDDRFRCG